MITPWSIACAKVAVYPGTHWNIQQALCMMALSSSADLEWVGGVAYHADEDEDEAAESDFASWVSAPADYDLALACGREVAEAFGRDDFAEQQADPRVRPPMKARNCLTLAVPEDVRSDWFAAVLHGLKWATWTNEVGYPLEWRRKNPHLVESFSFADGILVTLLGTRRAEAQRALARYPFTPPKFVASATAYWERHASH